MDLGGNVVDPRTGKITPARVQLAGGKITAIRPVSETFDTFLLPGFVDAHVHIESSMLVPSEFARVAVTHGTVATVSDPHEIANVLGVPGIRFMSANARAVPFHFCFGAPACVPATIFETAGATVTAADVAALFRSGECRYLSEVMNYPGVLAGDPDMLAKIACAKENKLPVDGHAPGVRGESARSYFAAGIQTDHECTRLDEATEKIACGAKILIREGSAAKNFEALWPLLQLHPDHAMLCSDDKHPDDLLDGHINLLVNRALQAGVALPHVLTTACVNPVEHYSLDVGLLRLGDSADFIETDSLHDFSSAHILRTFIRGRLVAERGRSLIPRTPIEPLNAFAPRHISPADLAVKSAGPHLRVIEAEEGQIITRGATLPARTENGLALSDPARDLLKIAVVNRYNASAPPAVAFIRGFGLKRGAIASSVAHDSHNVVAVGTSDAQLADAINKVMDMRGGLAVTAPDRTLGLPLPVAGLMSTDTAQTVGRLYAELQTLATQTLGATLKAPFMTLSFMALLVIPSLKLSDQGLFNGSTFSFTPLFES